MALECAFDSVMVDGSMFEEEENIRYVKSVVDRARKKNMTVEAELGRMDGREDGLPAVDLESVWTDPDRAAEFVKQTGVHFLAPSFGNVHGPYPPGGAEKYWTLDRLEKIHEALGDATPLVLHGTHPLSDEMVKVGMAKGMVKVNQNRNVRHGYHKYLEENCSKVELTKLQVQGVEEYSKGVERLMVEVLGSSGRA
ncbi:putative fructose-bisphosphate aldolase [Colletotrichum tropicale]|nr:putative fructose-bisphosphate aldolase [Colletotrichum tropicale]